MNIRILGFIGSLSVASVIKLSGQESNMPGSDSDSLFLLSGVIYDHLYHPVPASHVINMNSHVGDVTDTLGIFKIPVKASDTLLIRNIAFKDTLVPVQRILNIRVITMTRKYYTLQEALIFEWGSSYDDFKEAVVGMSDQQSLGESLGLPTQDPGYVPLEMDEQAVKSPAFLISSPVSFFYQNFNKHAKSARKVYWLQKNKAKQDEFDAIISRENMASLTGLTGADLQQFLVYLYEKMSCDFNCSEIAIYTEIHRLWDAYQILHGMQE